MIWTGRRQKPVNRRKRKAQGAAMPSFDSELGPLHFTDQGSGDGVILVHGFAASSEENWGRSGWISMLTRAQRRVVTLDLRGHGHSSKSHNPAAYTVDAFAGDVWRLSRQLDLKKPDLIGFSLGARIVLNLLAKHPDAFLLGVLCGAGGRWLEPSARDPNVLPSAFEAEDPNAIQDDMARRFRQFADAQGQDRLALAAVGRGLAARADRLERESLAAIRNEVFVVAGRSDELAGDPYPLAAALGRAKSTIVPGCGHMDCLVQPMFKGAVMDFLAGQP
jgi:pimeloyl-ACP methyl ester carboxylesterase